MTTYALIVYTILDLLKVLSDDSSILEEHVIFLVNKHRASVLKQRYADIKKEIPTSNYLTICLNLVKTPPIEGLPCEGQYYLKSLDKVPNVLPIGNPTVYPIDYYLGTIITYISRERMRFIGHNKYLSNIIYCSLSPDNYLYFQSNDPWFLYLEKVYYTGIFENVEDALKLSCNSEGNNCDILDLVFPLEDALIPLVIELVLKELLGTAYRPADLANDANDDLSDIASFLRRNMKSNVLKLIEG